MLHIENVSFVRNHIPLIQNLSLTLHASDGLLIQGPNGSGKTTFLKIIAGMLQPTSGMLLWQGHPLHQNSLTLGFISSHTPLQNELSVLENLRYWMVLYTKPKTKTILEALDFFGLSHKTHQLAGTLSAGEIQRTHLAKLRLISAQLWLLDEATAHLDQACLDRFRHTLLDLQSAGSIILCVSHHPLPDLNKTLTLGIQQP